MGSKLDDFVDAVLREPLAVRPYHVGRWLARLHPASAVIEGEDSAFDVVAYLRDGEGTGTVRSSIHPQITTEWRGPDKPLETITENAWYEVEWRSQRLDVLVLAWPDDGCTTRRRYILANDEETARAFYEAVCRHTSEIRGEVLVFERGHWTKNEDLYGAITAASFADLILPPAMKDELLATFRDFFEAKPMYERYGIPWKRGVLFEGPPGNGKTHCVKALVREMGRPCLYVKSIRSRHKTDHDSIRDVFERARQTRPCLLVLEDIETLVDAKNRSFFLNELDGFADNTGILTLATTNYAERLDPALKNRPSRFDRKFTFGLPQVAERFAFLARWNAKLESELQLTEEGLARGAELTAGFSFAYLKELGLSSMMRWVRTSVAGSMDEVLAEQAAVLREQVDAASRSLVPPEVNAEESE